MNILVYKIEKLENNINFIDSISRGLDFVLQDLDGEVDLWQSKKRRGRRSARFASLEPVQ